LPAPSRSTATCIGCSHMAAARNLFPLILRGGRYFRLCKPDWIDCSDTSFSKVHGGRWNSSGSFGALYLSATVEVAAANAREWHRDRAIKLFDLRPDRRPQLESFRVSERRFVDAVSDDGIAGLKMPKSYPFGVDWKQCQPIGKRAYEAGLPGVACRSAAEARLDSWLGEELALFDSAPRAQRVGRRRRFDEWYRDIVP
jgi:RES domain-containing protein